MPDSRAAALWLRAQAGPGRGAVRLAAAAGILRGLCGMAQTGVVAWCVHRILIEDATFTMLIPWFTSFAALVPLRALCVWVAETGGTRAAMQVKRAVRAALLERIHALGPAWRNEARSGGVSSVLVEQVEALDGFYARFLPQSRIAAVLPLAILATVFALDWVAGAILALAGPMVPVLMAVVGIGAAAESRRQFTTLARMSAYFLDRLQGLTTLRLYGRAESEIDAIARVADGFRERTMAVLRLAFLSSASLDFFAAVAIAGVAIYVGLGLLGAITWGPAGDLTLFTGLFALMLAPEFFQPLRQLAAYYHDRMSAVAATDALRAVLDAQPIGVTGTRRLADGPKSIVFTDVHVSFANGSRPALRGLTFRLDPGERRVLVGASGAGKSTILALVMGYLRPDAGRVSIDGIDLLDLDADDLRRHIAWVGQAPILFHGSLRDNIRLGRPGADAVAVDRAADAALVTGFADQLPEGLDTLIGDKGYGLSGGQMQRIALARAFLKDAPILLLDEPTAALDPATEREIAAIVERLAAGRTTIVVTHSPAVADCLGARIVIDDGRVAEAA
jgi:ATP-binding cassette subfamily C protein CydD